VEHKLEVDVHAHWSDRPPIYRLYVNDEMFTERTFGWPSYQIYLKEHLYCELDTGVHTLRLENLDVSSRLELDNFRINGSVVNKNLKRSNGATSEWRFIVDLVNQNSSYNPITVKLDQVSRPTPLAPPSPPSPPVQKPQPNLALIQRMRDLNNRAAKK
jgi:hypothetical protein